MTAPCPDRGDVDGPAPDEVACRTGRLATARCWRSWQRSARRCAAYGQRCRKQTAGRRGCGAAADCQPAPRGPGWWPLSAACAGARGWQRRSTPYLGASALLEICEPAEVWPRSRPTCCPGSAPGAATAWPAAARWNARSSAGASACVAIRRRADRSRRPRRHPADLPRRTARENVPGDPRHPPSGATL